jgi:hypothetical protein
MAVMLLPRQITTVRCSARCLLRQMQGLGLTSGSALQPSSQRLTRTKSGWCLTTLRRGKAYFRPVAKCANVLGAARRVLACLFLVWWEGCLEVPEKAKIREQGCIRGGVVGVEVHDDSQFAHPPWLLQNRCARKAGRRCIFGGLPRRPSISCERLRWLAFRQGGKVGSDHTFHL